MHLPSACGIIPQPQGQFTQCNMIFNNDRQQLRNLYFTTWQKFRDQQPLEPLEQQIAEVIQQHPEYHDIVSHPDLAEADFPPELGETNPFLHMGLHLAIREQVATDRPHGITLVYEKLVKKFQDPLAAEHKMMDYLVEAIWQAQRNNTIPDEQQYLANLKLLG